MDLHRGGRQGQAKVVNICLSYRSGGVSDENERSPGDQINQRQASAFDATPPDASGALPREQLAVEN